MFWQFLRTKYQFPSAITTTTTTTTIQIVQFLEIEAQQSRVHKIREWVQMEWKCIFFLKTCEKNGIRKNETCVRNISSYKLRCINSFALSPPPTTLFLPNSYSYSVSFLSLSNILSFLLCVFVLLSLSTYLSLPTYLSLSRSTSFFLSH